MGLINSALQVGRSALLAYQSALEVVGNNVSNAGSTTYTRQTPVLSPTTGIPLPEGFIPGGGVALTALQRNVDNSLENRIRFAMGDQADALAQQQTLGRIEGVMNELSDIDLSTLLQEFFNAFSSLQSQPQDIGVRTLVLSAGDSLAREIQRQRIDILSMRDELNRDLASMAEVADKLVNDIADLNVRITATEASGRGGANSLRDQRDGLLRQLGQMMQIEVREQPDGGVNVYVGNEQLLQGGLTRGITSTLDTVNGEPKTGIRFADNNGPITLRGGQMAGMVAARDTHVLGQVDALNSLASALITEVNRVHAQGQGLEGYTDVTGSYGVDDSTAALNSAQAGLSLTPQNGSFLLTVTDKNSGTSITSVIKVDLDGIGAEETLDSLAAQINATAANVTAAVTADGRLQLTAANGFEFSFAQDSSNVLASLGVNGFFTGSNAEDLAVNDVLISNPNMLAAATQRAPGDGSNAAAIAALGSNPVTGLGNRSLTEFYNGIAADVANRGHAAQSGVQAADAVAASLNAQRESVSGVSLDEETVSMMKLERAFQGAARFTSVVDQLIQEMLSIVG